MMTRIYILLCLFLLASCEQTSYEDLDYQLIWSDEFNSSDLQSNWNFEVGDGCEYGIQFWGNNEKQYYLEENAYVEDTVLIIKSQAIDYQYTDCNGNPLLANGLSARINTENKFEFTHGRVEASIKMDRARGLWHAFWMLPSNPIQPWPLSGEIDILEYYKDGNEDNIVHNVHFKGPSPGISTFIGTPEDFDLENFFDDANTFFNSFHLYALEWDNERIKWFIDNTQILQVDKEDHPLLEETWPFDEPFHLIFNTALGGTLGGEINFWGSKEMQVDYVRVYQKTLPQ